MDQSETSSGFSKNLFSGEKVKPWFFATFNIMISHTFPWNFIDIAQVVQKIWRYPPSTWTVFNNFWEILTSAYNKWSQLFSNFQPTLNRLINNCVKLYWYKISSSSNINEGQNNTLSPRKKLLSKNPVLLGLDVYWFYYWF